MVHSGIHHADSVIFIHAMRMFDTHFFAPYVSCDSPLGAHSYRYFPVSFLWMYGAAGSLGRLLHIPEFQWLGIINAVGMVTYLTTAYVFMVIAMPKYAPRAFLLLTLGGGLGGIFYVGARTMGWHTNPDFQDYFFRYALYELLEGPRMAPWLIAARLYYTLPLALCYGAATAYLLYLREPARRLWWIGAALLFAGAFLNLRLGPMIWGLLLLLLYVHTDVPLQKRVALAVQITIASFVALGLGWAMLQWNPVYQETALTLIRRSLWFSAFCSVAIFHLFLVPRILWREKDSLPFAGRLVLYGAGGYLVAYVILFALYHVYYGVFFRTADYAAAVRISDPALIGAVVGVAWVLRKATTVPPTSKTADPLQHWLLLWTILFLAVAISAWGQGWFLRLGPQRLVMFLGPPLCLLSSQALALIQERRPRTARVIIGTWLACGLCSIIVAALYFQGPLGLDKPGTGPFAEYHGEVMSEADAACLESLGDGVVLAPATLPSFGDFVTVRGNTGIHGLGAWDLADKSALYITKSVNAFFALDSSDDIRRAVIGEWCVDWVYCPDSNPVDPAVREQLRRIPWLEEVAAQDDALLFRVLPDTEN